MLCRLCLHLITKKQEAGVLRGCSVHANGADCPPLQRMLDKLVATNTPKKVQRGTRSARKTTNGKGRR